MSPQQNRRFSPEEISVVHEYIDASNQPIDFPITEEVSRTLSFFNEKLIKLVRTAIKIAEEEPDLEEFEQLRWVPVAKSLVRAGLRDKYGASGGAENSLLFADHEIELQMELYAEAMAPDNPQGIENLADS